MLRRHCAEADRDPAEIEVTHLSPLLLGTDAADVAARVDGLVPHGTSRRAASERLLAGTVDDHIGRFRQLAEAGVATAMVSLADLHDASAVERFAPVIDAFVAG